jgi:hypothetical protein
MANMVISNVVMSNVVMSMSDHCIIYDPLQAHMAVASNMEASLPR